MLQSLQLPLREETRHKTRPGRAFHQVSTNARVDLCVGYITGAAAYRLSRGFDPAPTSAGAASGCIRLGLNLNRMSARILSESFHYLVVRCRSLALLLVRSLFLPCSSASLGLLIKCRGRRSCSECFFVFFSLANCLSLPRRTPRNTRLHPACVVLMLPFNDAEEHKNRSETALHQYLTLALSA